MTRKKTYRTKVRLRKNTAEVDGAYCNCKAGANGYCKHVAQEKVTNSHFGNYGVIPNTISQNWDLVWVLHTRIWDFSKFPLIGC